MTNLIPVLSPTGDEPLLIHRCDGATGGSGSGTDIGTVRSATQKNPGGLDPTESIAAIALQVNQEVTGQNGRRYDLNLQEKLYDMQDEYEEYADRESLGETLTPLDELNRKRLLKRIERLEDEIN